MRCPHCGEGRLFGRFLKVLDHCPVCGEELFHHRADDFPAYIVIVIVGHVIVSGILAVEIAYRPPYWVHLAIWLPLTVIGALALLQPVKGAIVGLQWQLGMHGFEESRARRVAAAARSRHPAIVTAGAQQLVEAMPANEKSRLL
jgi:uncharacterized protein (DUF983 family)